MAEVDAGEGTSKALLPTPPARAKVPRVITSPPGTRSRAKKASAAGYADSMAAESSESMADALATARTRDFKFDTKLASMTASEKRKMSIKLDGALATLSTHARVLATISYDEFKDLARKVFKAKHGDEVTFETTGDAIDPDDADFSPYAVGGSMSEVLLFTRKTWGDAEQKIQSLLLKALHAQDLSEIRALNGDMVDPSKKMGRALLDYVRPKLNPTLTEGANQERYYLGLIQGLSEVAPAMQTHTHPANFVAKLRSHAETAREAGRSVLDAAGRRKYEDAVIDVQIGDRGAAFRQSQLTKAVLKHCLSELMVASYKKIRSLYRHHEESLDACEDIYALVSYIWREATADPDLEEKYGSMSAYVENARGLPSSKVVMKDLRPNKTPRKAAAAPATANATTDQAATGQDSGRDNNRPDCPRCNQAGAGWTNFFGGGKVVVVTPKFSHDCSDGCTVVTNWQGVKRGDKPQYCGDKTPGHDRRECRSTQGREKASGARPDAGGKNAGGKKTYTKADMKKRMDQMKQDHIEKKKSSANATHLSQEEAQVVFDKYQELLEKENPQGQAQATYEITMGELEAEMDAMSTAAHTTSTQVASATRGGVVGGLLDNDTDDVLNMLIDAETSHNSNNVAHTVGPSAPLQDTTSAFTYTPCGDPKTDTAISEVDDCYSELSSYQKDAHGIFADYSAGMVPSEAALQELSGHLRSARNKRAELRMLLQGADVGMAAAEILNEADKSVTRCESLLEDLERDQAQRTASGDSHRTVAKRFQQVVRNGRRNRTVAEGAFNLSLKYLVLTAMLAITPARQFIRAMQVSSLTAVAYLLVFVMTSRGSAMELNVANASGGTTALLAGHFVGFDTMANRTIGFNDDIELQSPRKGKYPFSWGLSGNATFTADAMGDGYARVVNIKGAEVRIPLGECATSRSEGMSLISHSRWAAQHPNNKCILAGPGGESYLQAVDDAGHVQTIPVCIVSNLTYLPVTRAAWQAYTARTANATNGDAMTIHRRWAHLSAPMIQNARKAGVVQDDRHQRGVPNLMGCEHCFRAHNRECRRKTPLAKIDKDEKILAPVTTAAGQIVGCDLKGPLHADAHGKYVYMISFVDYHTRRIVMYGLTSKSDASKALKLYHANECKAKGVPLLLVHPDSEKVLTAGSFGKTLTDLGVACKPSPAYTKYANSLAETTWKSTFLGANAMLDDTCLGTKHWFYAVLYRVYCLNRGVKTVDGKTSCPEALWTAKDTVDGSQMRAFGCLAFVYRSSHNKAKSDPADSSTVPCAFLGIDHTHLADGKLLGTQGLIFLDLTDGTVFVTAQHSQSRCGILWKEATLWYDSIYYSKPHAAKLVQPVREAVDVGTLQRDAPGQVDAPVQVDTQVDTARGGDVHQPERDDRDGEAHQQAVLPAQTGKKRGKRLEQEGNYRSGSDDSEDRNWTRRIVRPVESTGSEGTPTDKDSDFQMDHEGTRIKKLFNGRTVPSNGVVREEWFDKENNRKLYQVEYSDGSIEDLSERSLLSHQVHDDEDDIDASTSKSGKKKAKKRASKRIARVNFTANLTQESVEEAIERAELAMALNHSYAHHTLEKREANITLLDPTRQVLKQTAGSGVDHKVEPSATIKRLFDSTAKQMSEEARHYDRAGPYKNHGGDNPTWRQVQRMPPNMVMLWMLARVAEICGLEDGGEIIPMPLAELSEKERKGVLRGIERLKMKRDEHGVPVKPKARFCADGRGQVEGFNYFGNSTCPTMSIDGVRLLVCLATQMGTKLVSFDKDQAFLQSKNKEIVYVRAPADITEIWRHSPGRLENFKKKFKNFKNGDPVVYLCKASLYGLKDSARNHYDDVRGWMKEIGSHQVNHEPSMWVRHDRPPTYQPVPQPPVQCTLDFSQGAPAWNDHRDVARDAYGQPREYNYDTVGVNSIHGLYIDDELCAFKTDKLKNEYVKRMKQRWRCQYQGEATYFIGLCIEQLEGRTILHQKAHAEEITERFKLPDKKYPQTPYCPNFDEAVPATTPEQVCNVNEYQQKVGALLFLLRTRPDMAFCLSALSRAMSQPTAKCHEAADHALLYLKGTKAWGLQYKRVHPDEFKLKVWSDSDHASSKPTRKSQAGYMVSLGSDTNLVSFKSQRMPSVTLSSTESEMVAASFATRECLYFRQTLAELGARQKEATTIFIDNQSTIRWLENPIRQTERKHIAIRRMFNEEMQEREECVYEYINTKLNPADYLTKSSQTVDTFKAFRAKFMVNLTKDPAVAVKW